MPNFKLHWPGWISFQFILLNAFTEAGRIWKIKIPFSTATVNKPRNTSQNICMLQGLNSFNSSLVKSTIYIFWGVTLCRQMSSLRRSEWLYRLHLQGKQLFVECHRMRLNAKRFFKRLGNTFPPKRRHTPRGLNTQQHCCENPNSRTQTQLHRSTTYFH
jgi:hypothetical protein